MDRDFFIAEIAEQLEIVKGKTESIHEWYCRIIYSAIGRMTLSALWNGDDESVSVTYLKRKIKSLQNNYLSIFPEIKKHFFNLSEIIYDLYLVNGYFYHSSNWISSAIKSEIKIGNCSLIRGDYMSENLSMCGLGLYRNLLQKTQDNLDVAKDLLCQTDYAKYVKLLINDAKWTELTIDNKIEYLRLDGYWSKGYWKNNPDTDGGISLLRLGSIGSYLYLLYRYEDSDCLVAALPEYATQNFEYLSIACGLLLIRNRWPGYVASEDGSLVGVRLNYLLPPSLMNFFKLYSWPYFERCDSSVDKEYNDFVRVMDKNIYDVFEKIMEKTGLKRN